MGAYVWRADGSDADWTTDGVANTGGTDHDVPDQLQCLDCHLGEPGRILGFAAIQLGDAAVADLVAAGLVSHAPAKSLALPWDQKTNAAFGLFYGNCGSCHSPIGSAQSGTSQILRITTAELAGPREQTAVWQSIVGIETDHYMAGVIDRVQPGMPAMSAIVMRMASRVTGDAMPPIATKHTDDAGVAAVTAWIQSL
jgi:hypothetical protein